ncbi:MAG: hypothetical protein LBH66_00765 [Oscillospiraceae bacterium]|nr:hypothetical protein [Oscillospiraceae bacterium]
MLTEEFKVEDFIKSWHAHWLAEGIQLGAEKNKRDTVMRLRKAGADIDIIAIATNLSREEILRLE